MESSQIPDLEWVWDKPLYVDFHGGCCPSKRRIDLRAIVDGTVLAIEIDENEHKAYSVEDEQARYNDLFMDFSGKYVFLRINPDEYIDKDSGNKIDPPFEQRLSLVCDKINEIVSNIPTSTELVEIHHMFYS